MERANRTDCEMAGMPSERVNGECAFMGKTTMNWICWSSSESIGRMPHAFVEYSLTKVCESILIAHHILQGYGHPHTHLNARLFFKNVFFCLLIFFFIPLSLALMLPC